MNCSDIFATELDEYQTIGSSPVINIDFTNGIDVGGIANNKLQLRVWKLENGNELIFGAIHNNPAKPLGYVLFQRMSGDAKVLIAKNAWVDPEYRRQAIQTELFQFVNKVEHFQILSDTQLTKEGEALWKSLTSSSSFNSNIVYVPTGELYSINDIGKKKTSDGFTVISPEDDCIQPDFWNGTIGQRFFYILESKGKFYLNETEGLRYFGICESRHKGSSLMGQYNYFAEGYP